MQPQPWVCLKVPCRRWRSMELRAYLLRHDGKGGAVEHCADSLPPREEKAPLQSPGRARASSPAPALSSEDEAAPEFVGKEAATIYLVVLVGCEVKKVAHLSFFLEGRSSTEKAEEATGEGEDGRRRMLVQTLKPHHRKTKIWRRRWKEGVASETSSQKEEISSQEEENEDASDTSPGSEAHIKTKTGLNTLSR